MMTNLSCNVIEKLAGKTLVTAESCTGGGIGAALTAIPGSSAVYKGGVICYTNWVKQNVLGIDEKTLFDCGAVSEPVAIQMAKGAQNALQSDIALSVTGLAGPTGDDYGNPVGTVFIGYCDRKKSYAKKFLFSGDREAVRTQAVKSALEILLNELQ